MISIKEVEEIHKKLIETFGGSPGIRDLSALNSALARPFQTFDDIDFISNSCEQGSIID